MLLEAYVLKRKRHQMALIKLYFDGLSVNDPKTCGLNFPRSTHGLKNQKEGDLGSVIWGLPRLHCFAVLRACWHNHPWIFCDGDSQDG